MAACDTCGNEYEQCLEVQVAGETYFFDCLECAAQRLAPVCGHCGVRILGHGLGIDDRFFCCAHCARAVGVWQFRDSA